MTKFLDPLMTTKTKFRPPLDTVQYSIWSPGTAEFTLPWTLRNSHSTSLDMQCFGESPRKMSSIGGVHLLNGIAQWYMLFPLRPPSLPPLLPSFPLSVHLPPSHSRHTTWIASADPSPAFASQYLSVHPEAKPPDGWGCTPTREGWRRWNRHTRMSTTFPYRELW